MNLQEKMEGYLEYCIYRKELDVKTVKAYRIDLNQFFSFVCCNEPEKETIESYITDLHKKYKQKTVKRKIASVKAFYSYLEEEEVLKQNLFRKIKVKFNEAVCRKLSSNNTKWNRSSASGSNASHCEGVGMLGDITAADEIYIVTGL